MTRKQVDWDVRVRPFTDGGGDPLPALKNMYHPGLGWELLSTQVAMVSAGQISIVYTFARYEYVSDEPATAREPEFPVSGLEGTDTTNQKRRGRPPKVEVAEQLDYLFGSWKIIYLSIPAFSIAKYFEEVQDV